jgi:hypothetical protein
MENGNRKTRTFILNAWVCVNIYYLDRKFLLLFFWMKN